MPILTTHTQDWKNIVSKILSLNLMGHMRYIYDQKILE